MSIRNTKKSRQSKAVVALMVSVAVMVFFIFNLTQEIISRRQVTKTIVRLQAAATELENENIDLENKISQWQNSSRLEKEARLKLSLKKPGENVVLITNNQPAISDSSDEFDDKMTAEETNSTVGSNIIKWWEYFFY